MDGWQIHIHASDLNRSYLAQAAVGKFRPWALRSISEEMKTDCFAQDGRVWTIHPRYKQWISFHQMNLVESEFSAPLAEGVRFDLILCRNVMMYFTPKVSRHLVAQFHGSLEEGGWLLVGASEYNLENYTAFQTVNTPEAKLYQEAWPCADCDDAPRSHHPQRLENATRNARRQPGISSCRPRTHRVRYRRPSTRHGASARTRGSWRLAERGRMSRNDC